MSTVIPWEDPELDKILVLKLYLEYDRYKVRFCIGRMKDGKLVDVKIPFTELPRSRMRDSIVAHAKASKLFACGLDIFSAIFIK